MPVGNIPCLLRQSCLTFLCHYQTLRLTSLHASFFTKRQSGAWRAGFAFRQSSKGINAGRIIGHCSQQTITVQPRRYQFRTISSGFCRHSTRQLYSIEFGLAVYDVNIDVLNGGSFTPQLSLSYNSQSGGYGIAGYGFNLKGLSAITRGGKDLFHDGLVSGTTYTDNDTYFLDGKRLILQSGKDGNGTITYSVEEIRCQGN